MIPPPLLLGATVAFWGYQTGQITVALIVAAALEAPQLVKSRWEVSPVDFRRLVALCSVLFTLVIAYFVITASTRDAVTKVLQWLPLILLPLIVAQRYAVADRLDPSALFLLLRQREGQRSGRGSGIIVGYPYFALCLLAGSAAEIRTPWFYAGSCILAIWALWPLRT
ncbi:MAG: hypothetical protein GY731_08070, partial [Gammaproteobacteria bacterium]|nr:hypothetical protein [Gammaproteobacteria bacterium]